MIDTAKAPTPPRPLTFEEWERQGIELFGSDKLKWRFVCPSCGHVQCPEDFRPYKETGANAETAMLSCIGRYDGEHGHVVIGTKPGPCNYTSGGLFNLNPVKVISPITNEPVRVFDFDRTPGGTT